MANIMQMFRAKNKVTRDSYDLSKKLAYTAQLGELLPVYSRVVMPGDKFKISSRWKTRTAPVNTAAFTRFREYYDWYFVPFQLLWDKYHVWSTNMKDNNQVATSIKGTTLLSDKHPYFTTNQIKTYLHGMAVGEGNPIDPDLYRPTVNNFGFPRHLLMKKLLHLLGYGDFYNDEATPLYNLELSPWRALAYQKIYQDWYRNSQWEASSPQTCNINYLSGSSDDLQIPIGEYQIWDDSMFDMRYANWNKDLFMGLLPNSQYGDAASIDLLGVLNTSLGATSDTQPFGILSKAPSPDMPVMTKSLSITDFPSRLVVRDSSAGDINDFGLSAEAVRTIRSAMNISSSGNIQSAFTILALRQAEAKQKFQEIQQSNSKDFPSQTEAHFGVRPSNAYSQRCQRIGGYDGTIEISDIDNTNITENEDGSFNGAEIAGKGLSYGSSGNTIDFSTEIPGVIMCIYHVVPLLDYALGNVAMDNMKTMFTDYAIPEFDRTGMVQVPLAAFTNKASDILNGSNNITLNDGLLGYAPNYIDYKTDIDEVKGAFYNGGLGAWVAPITDQYIRQWFYYSAGSSGNSYRWNGLNFNFFKVNPRIVDPIFAQATTGSVSSDKFWINCYWDIKAVRPLDAQGLPY